uniref:TAFII28-like protein domain-containing protein n=1 Tax=Otus sunia TaxID=257818 RepID=A0A8C8AM15_9STRI
CALAQVRSAEGEAVDGEDPSLQPSAAKKVKLELKERKEKKHKVDEDEIQKIILVSSFSEEQLNRYEMYRRSAFPKAAIKRVRLQRCFATNTLSRPSRLSLTKPGCGLIWALHNPSWLCGTYRLWVLPPPAVSQPLWLRPLSDQLIPLWSSLVPSRSLCSLNRSSS